MFKPALTAVLLGGLACSASAQQPPAQPKQQINMFWVEDPSCKKWTESRTSEIKRVIYEMWALGFVSGHNYANPKQQVPAGAMPRGENFYRFLDDYCKQNPGNSFIDAIIDVTTVQRGSAPSAPAKSTPAKK